MRVIKIYQSTCPPPPPPPFLRLAVLLAPLLASTSLHFRLAPPPLPPCQPCQLVAKLFANCPAQCALLDVNLRAAQLSVHRWTSTWDLPSSVCTAGPQPGTCPAQCAPLDLNGQIRPDRMPEDIPDKMPDKIRPHRFGGEGVLIGGQNSNTKCSMTFVNIAVAISALAGGGAKTVSHRDQNTVVFSTFF